MFSLVKDEKSCFINYLKVVQGSIIQSYTTELQLHLDEDKVDILQMAIIEIT